MLAFIFPGQGSQSVGMGKEVAGAFAAAKEVFEEVDETLKQKLSKICFEGPETDLTLTENTQPAIMATSMAIFRVLQKEGKLDLSKSAKYVAGHSLGEYSALAAAGTFNIAQAAKLLKLRGQAMQQAVPQGFGAMAALMGADIALADEITNEAAGGEVCEISNDNAPGQVVISGHMSAINRAIEIAAAKGVKRAVKLNVSAPFHCALMKPAAEIMRAALQAETLKKPIVEVVANVTAGNVSDPEAIKELLAQQVTKAVRWRESVEFMKSQGITKVVEVGSGKVLSGLVKRIDKEIEAVSIESPQDIENFLKNTDLKQVA